MNPTTAGLPQAAGSEPSAPGTDGTPPNANPPMQSSAVGHSASPNTTSGAARGQPFATAPHLAVGPYPVLNNKRGPVAVSQLFLRMSYRAPRVDCRPSVNDADERRPNASTTDSLPAVRPLLLAASVVSPTDGYRAGSCAESGLAAECVFPPKGTSFIDRAPAKKARRSQDTPTPDGTGSAPPNTTMQSTAHIDTSAGSLGVPIAPGPSPLHGGHSHTQGPSPIHLSHPHHPHSLAQLHEEDVKPIASPITASPTGPAGRYPSIARTGSGGSNPKSRLTPKPGSSPASTAEETLPPLELLEEACEIFFGQVNQCAFLHKPSFLARLGDPVQSPSPLLLLSICALTVRFSPSLAQFCGTTKKSATYFHDTARALLFDSLGTVLDSTLPCGDTQLVTGEPSVEACQAGYFLGLADWSACRGRRSWMIMGIATRSTSHLYMLFPTTWTHGLYSGSTPRIAS
jgi:hypothetical protein